MFDVIISRMASGIEPAIALVSVILLLGVSSTAAKGTQICISTRDVINTEPQKDGRAIFFTMRDGSVWRNDLKGRCPALNFYGFEWVVRNPNYTVCENEQSLRVLHSGEICILGKFSQVKSPRHS